jgi:hypothetical protein
MKVVVLYRPNSEQGRPVEEFTREFARRYPDVKLEITDIDSREGGALAALYDIMQYPAIMVLRDEGGVQNIWQGGPLPLMDEVMGYVHAAA